MKRRLDWEVIAKNSYTKFH